MKWIDLRDAGFELTSRPHPSGATLFVLVRQGKILADLDEQLQAAGFKPFKMGLAAPITWQRADVLAKLPGAKLIEVDPADVGYEPKKEERHGISQARSESATGTVRPGGATAPAGPPSDGVADPATQRNSDGLVGTPAADDTGIYRGSDAGTQTELSDQNDARESAELPGSGAAGAVGEDDRGGGTFADDDSDPSRVPAGGSSERLIDLATIRSREEALAAGLEVEMSEGVGKNHGRSFYRIVLHKGMVFIQNGQKRVAKYQPSRSLPVELGQPADWGTKTLGSLHDDEWQSQDRQEIKQAREKHPQLAAVVDHVAAHAAFEKYPQELLWLDLYGRMTPFVDGRRKRQPRLYQDQNMVIFALVANQPGMTEEAAREWAADQGITTVEQLDSRLYQWANERLASQQNESAETGADAKNASAAAEDKGEPRISPSAVSIAELRQQLTAEEQARIVAEFPPADQLGFRPNLMEHDFLDIGEKGDLLKKARAQREQFLIRLAEDVRRYEALRENGVDALSDYDIRNEGPAGALRTALKFKSNHITYDHSVIAQADAFLVCANAQEEWRGPLRQAFLLERQNQGHSAEAIVLYRLLGSMVVPGLRPQDIEEAGRLYLMRETGQITNEQWQAKLQEWQESNRIHKEEPAVVAEAAEPVLWQAQEDQLLYQGQPVSVEHIVAAMERLDGRSGLSEAEQSERRQLRDALWILRRANARIAYDYDTLEIVKVRGRSVRITRDSAATAIEPGYFPISETGYRSFLGQKLTPELLEERAAERDKERAQKLKSFARELAGAKKQKEATYRSMSIARLMDMNLSECAFCKSEERVSFLQNSLVAAQSIVEMVVEDPEIAENGDFDAAKALIPLIEEALKSEDLVPLFKAGVRLNRPQLLGGSAYLRLVKGLRSTDPDVAETTETFTETAKQPQTATRQTKLPAQKRSQVVSLLNPRHFTITDEIDREAGFCPKARFEENVNAIRVLKSIEAEGREATPEEKAVLVRYNGWGGLAQVFDRNAPVLSDEMQQERGSDWVTQARGSVLPELLTEAEHASARASVNNAHFTPPETIRAIWDAVRRMGFKGGQVLEPSMGVGSFLGLVDKDLVAKCRFTGVELDDLTGRIAQTIYPDADIRIAGFEETKLPNGFFDLVVSNVPFGNYQVFDPKYDHHKLSIHDYFIVKALDKLKPGGLCAVITSNHTMDKISSKARRMMAARGELVGALRLPDNAQEAQAGCRVTTDILFFRKHARDPQLAETPVWVETESAELRREWLHYESSAQVPLNRYFVENPDAILGQFKLGRGQYGRERALVEPTEPLAELLPGAVKRLSPVVEVAPGTALDEDETLQPRDLDAPVEEASELMADFGQRAEGSFILNEEDGHVYQVLEGGEQAAPTNLKGKPLQRVIGMIRVRDAMDEVFRLQKEHPEDTPESTPILEASRELLNQVYDDFVKQFGALNLPANRRLFLDDPEFGRLMALELYDDDSGDVHKSEVFANRVLQASKPVDSVDTPLEGLVVSLNYKGGVDLDYIARLCGQTAEEVAEHLSAAGEIFHDPEGRHWVTAADYLSGNVRRKLADAEAAAVIDESYADNVRRLKEIQPEDLGPKDIDVRLGSPWIPEEVIRDFIIETLDLQAEWQKDEVSVKYRPLNGQWVIDAPEQYSKLKATHEFGTSRKSFMEILSDRLNQNTITVTDPSEVEGGRPVVNVKETVLAQQKADLIQQKFRDFLWADEARTERLLQIYNDRFNAYVPPRFDGSHLTFPGMSCVIKPRPHQANAVWRGLQTGNLGAAHEVGVGKTLVQIALAIEMTRLGKAHKPLMIVPNHMLEQMEREARQLYPSARILAVSRKDLQKNNRKRFMGKVANNNWDLVIMTHSMFSKVGVDPQFEARFIQQELEAYRAELEEVDTKDRASRRRNGVKAVEAKIKRLEAKLKGLTAAKKSDDGIYLDDMGIDALLVDESHNFKNLAVETGGRSEVSESISGSARAWDLFLKSRWLYEKRGGVSGLVFSSATPVSNNVLEIYNVQRYLQPDLLQEMGLTSTSAWAGTFLTPKTQWEPSPSGNGWKLRTRFALNNLPELMRALRVTLDVVTADEAGIERPEPVRSNITAEMSEYQKRYMKYLDMRVKRMQGGGVDPSEDNILKIVSEGRQLALDPRLLLPSLPDYEGSKVNKAVARMFDRYQKTTADKGAQMLFIDLGTPKKGRFSVYDDIRTKLVEKGVPADEIAFIHDYPKDEDKAELFAKVRSGEIRFLLGSTGKMGEGTNAQDRLVGLGHLDAPWRPSDIEQRNGRAIRQGNKNATVDIDIYTTEDTFDLFMWNTLKIKAETFSRVIRGDVSVRRLDLDVDPTYAETAAITSNDTLIKEKLELEQEIGRLELLQKGHADALWRARRDVRYYSESLAEAEDRLELESQIPRPTGDTRFWTLDMKPFGFDSNFEGEREKLLPLLAKLMTSQKISELSGLRCAGVPVSIKRYHDSERDRKYTIWHVGEKGHTIVCHQAAKVEDLLAGLDKKISDTQKQMAYFQKRKDEAEQASSQEFPDAVRLEELYGKYRGILQRIQEATEAERDGQGEANDIWTLDDIKKNLTVYIMGGNPGESVEEALMESDFSEESVFAEEERAVPWP